MNSALFEYRNMSARKGAQFVPIGMPTICWKTFSPKTTKMLSTRNSSMLMILSSVYLFFVFQGDFIMFDEIPISTIKLPEGRFQTFHGVSLSEELK